MDGQDFASLVNSYQVLCRFYSGFISEVDFNRTLLAHQDIKLDQARQIGATGDGVAAERHLQRSSQGAPTGVTFDGQRGQRRTRQRRFRSLPPRRTIAGRTLQQQNKP